jgi:predicted dehydrogenase
LILVPGGSTIRLAVVGVGHLGSAHARVYRDLEGVELVAVCDSDGGKARRCAGETGARALTDYREVPDDAEAVSVVVPTALHREVAEHFLARGKAVLVEKPMAPTSEEAARLLEAAERTGCLLHVGHIERFNPAVRAARPHLVRPRFVECRRVAPFSFRSKDIGVVFDLMIHDLDIISWLVAEPVVRVDAVGKGVLLPHEDVANARLVFEGGCVADLTASRVAAKAERALRIFQDRSYLSIDTLTPRVRLFRPTGRLERGELDVSRIEPGDLEDARDFVFKELIEVKKLDVPPETPLEAELGAFAEAVRTGGAEPESEEAPRGVTGREGLEAIRLAETILEQIGGEEGK